MQEGHLSEAMVLCALGDVRVAESVSTYKKRLLNSGLRYGPQSIQRSNGHPSS